MKISLPNQRSVTIRLLIETDKEQVYNYLQNLSPESRSRFGPHPFDMQTVEMICKHPDNEILRYIAVSESPAAIIAYMLIKQGMIASDQQRYAQRNQFYEYATTVTYAPSVADDWQSSGLGTAMHTIIETELKSKGIQHIILWGGVQASNEKAVNFYKKNGYRFIDSFWHDGKDNHDMVKEIA